MCKFHDSSTESTWSGPEREPRPPSDASLEAGLNAMAEHGWELTFLNPPAVGQPYTLVFTRERSDQGG